MNIRIEGNGLCLQCHSNEEYNVKSHHQHNESSVGAECVSCHMPTNRYMGVDDRRDHSFKIPRPDLSSQFSIPNACNACHQEKSNQWASDHLKNWNGQPNKIISSKRFLMLLNSGEAINLEDHLSIIADENLDVISRATAIQLLAYTTQTITADILSPYLKHKENLLRLSAVHAATLLPRADRISLLVPLLSEKYKAIRVSAANSLVGSKIPAAEQAVFINAFHELQHVNDISSWRGEGRMNKGISALNNGYMTEAEKAFKGAIAIEPFFEIGYINLADLYRLQQQPSKVNTVLIEGMNKLPKSAAIKYTYGLHLVRQKNLANAVVVFEEAMLLSTDNAQYAYTYILALDGMGQGKQALSKLKVLIVNYPNKAQLRELGLYLSQKLNNKADYDWFMKL